MNWQPVCTQITSIIQVLTLQFDRCNWLWHLVYVLRLFTCRRSFSGKVQTFPLYFATRPRAIFYSCVFLVHEGIPIIAIVLIVCQSHCNQIGIHFFDRCPRPQPPCTRPQPKPVELSRRLPRISEPKFSHLEIVQLIRGRCFDECNAGSVVDSRFAEKTGLEVTSAWPTTTCPNTAPEQRLTAARKTPAGNRQSCRLSPSVLLAQSLQTHSCFSAAIFA